MGLKNIQPKIYWEKKKKKSTGVLGIKAKTKKDEKKCFPRQDSLGFFFSLIK